MRDWKTARDIESEFEWRKWAQEIPALQFKSDWLVKVIPPYAGAVARFLVFHKLNPKEQVSVYLDCYNQLGFMDKPYWEIYPAKDGDTERFNIEDTANLIQAIDDSLTERLIKK